MSDIYDQDAEEFAWNRDEPRVDLPNPAEAVDESPATFTIDNALGYPRGDFWVRIDGDGPYLASRSLGGTLTIKRRMNRFERILRAALRWVWRHWTAIFVALILILVAFIAGRQVEARSAACHSATEDSVITDCDYRDGGWYEE